MMKAILFCLGMTILTNTAFTQNPVAENGQLQVIDHQLIPDGLKLPAICATPDGMAIAPDGSLLLTCPNFADQTKKACILKIDRNFKVSLFFEFPPYKPTGVVCPMGIDVDKNGEYLYLRQPGMERHA